MFKYFLVYFCDVIITVHLFFSFTNSVICLEFKNAKNIRIINQEPNSLKDEIIALRMLSKTKIRSN